MAFFDFLFGGPAGQIKKHSRRVGDRDAQAEDREASARWLAEDGSEDAIRGLFNRFNLQLEHSLKDQREKEYVLDLLAQRGLDAARIGRGFARSSPNYAWPLRLVERIEGATAGVDLLLDLLGEEKLENEWKPEKKRTLLISLAERKDARIVGAATRFLADFDEGVRNAAVEAIAAQDGDGGREPLLAALVNPKEESTRIRGRLAEVFVTRRWEISADPWLLANVPTGYRAQDNRLVAGR